MNRRPADPLILRRKKQRVSIPAGDGPPYRQIRLEGFLAGLIEIDDSNLVAFAQNPQSILLDVPEIESHQFGDPQSAVEEQSQNAVIPLLMLAVHAVQKLHAFIQSQVFRQGFAQFGGIDIFDRIFTK